VCEGQHKAQQKLTRASTTTERCPRLCTDGLTARTPADRANADLVPPMQQLRC
jgi:hypothetical protein